MTVFVSSTEGSGAGARTDLNAGQAGSASSAPPRAALEEASDRCSAPGATSEHQPNPSCSGVPGRRRRRRVGAGP